MAAKTKENSGAAHPQTLAVGEENVRTVTAMRRLKGEAVPSTQNSATVWASLSTGKPAPEDVGRDILQG